MADCRENVGDTVDLYELSEHHRHIVCRGNVFFLIDAAGVGEVRVLRAGIGGVFIHKG